MTPSQILDFCGQVFINFRDYTFNDRDAHGYRWVDLKRFTLRSPPADDTTLLCAVIQHEQFRDDYAGGSVDPQEIRHGPYWLHHITTCAYEPVSKSDSITTLTAWAGQHGNPPEQLNATLDREVLKPIDQATSHYSLKNLGQTAFHDWGRVHTDFHELIVINQPASTLALIVAADD